MLQNKLHVFVDRFTEALVSATLSSAEAPAGYPHQNINNRQK